MSKKPMTKEEQRYAAPDPIFDEGRSWFQYVRKEFEEKGGTVPLYERGGRDFFLAIGLLGRLADFDYDDVVYTLEEE